MPLTPEQRRVLATFLDLDELEREPSRFHALIQSNELTTALAHLAARCGDKSFLLRCLAAGVLRVAIEDADADALAITAEGRVGSVIHDPDTDANQVAVNAAGRLGVVIRDPETDGFAVAVTADGHMGAYLLSRDASANSVLTLDYHSGRGPTATHELDHAGGGVETIDLASAACMALVITAAAGPIACYRSSSAGAKELPMGICNPYAPLRAATEQRYLDLDTAQAGLIHVLAFPLDALS